MIKNNLAQPQFKPSPTINKIKLLEKILIKLQSHPEYKTKFQDLKL